MRVLSGTLALGLIAGFAQTQAYQTTKSGSSAQSDKTQHNPTPKRVRAKLDGFDLAPRPVNGGDTQIGGASRGLGTPTTLLAPNEGKSYSLLPLFQWSNSNRNIKAYNFQLLDAAGQLLYETRVNGTSFTYPTDAPGLKPGSSYTWTVQPSTGLLGGPAEPVQIDFLGDSERTQIESALAKVSGVGQQKSLAEAAVFVDHRLWYDAVQRYSELIDAHPEDGSLYQERATIYAQLPQTTAAADQDLNHGAKSKAE